MNKEMQMVDREWRVGVCAHCLVPLVPEQVTSSHAVFCSLHCQKQAESVRYVRRAIRDGRIADPKTAVVVRNNMIVFLALDIAYVRPQVPQELRVGVLTRNGGMCVECNEVPATEVDHISGGSQAPENLRGLCRSCHEMKPRGAVPDDLTRDGNGKVDDTPTAAVLQTAWLAAIRASEPLGDTPEWHNLRRCANEHIDTRFGWLTHQILCDQPASPAHQEETWKSQWAQIRSDYLAWARSSTHL